MCACVCVFHIHKLPAAAVDEEEEAEAEAEEKSHFLGFHSGGGFHFHTCHSLRNNSVKVVCCCVRSTNIYVCMYSVHPVLAHLCTQMCICMYTKVSKCGHAVTVTFSGFEVLIPVNYRLNSPSDILFIFIFMTHCTQLALQ